MPGHVIVGFDGSSAATGALVWAVDEAGRRHTETVAVAVVDAPPGDPPAGAEWSAHAEITLARRLQAELDPWGVRRRIELEIRRGHPAAELLAACTEADLLVVGSRGQNPIKGLLLGSVSRACLDRAPCPVVVVHGVPRPADPHRRVLVGVDGSVHSRRALQVAAEEAALRGDVVHAVHAVHWDAIGVELVSPDHRQLVEWGTRLVKHELAQAGVAARPLVVAGTAGEVLVGHSAHADLLVLGARGHHTLTGTLLGSTSDHCVRHGHCPVMVVRARPDEGPAS